MSINYFYIIILFILGACDSKITNETKLLSDNAIELFNKYQKGETYFIITDWNEIVQSIDPMKIHRSDTIQMQNKMKFTVNEIDRDGNAIIEGQYYAMKMGKFNSEDSSTYDQSFEGKMFREMMKRKIIMTVNKKGKILSLSGAEGMFSMGNSKAKIDDNKIMIENIENSTQVFPDQKIKVGSSWKRESKISYGYPCKYNTVYTVKQIKDGNVYIAVKAVMTPNFTAPPTYFPGGVELHQELHGTQTGEVIIDIKKGKITNSIYHSNISGASKGKSGDMQIDMQIQTNLTIQNHIEYPDNQ